MRPCPLCGSTTDKPLTEIRPGRSVRTDGTIVPLSVDRRHCSGCGLGARPAVTEQDLATLYGESYQLYANRPQAEAFDPSRYSVLCEALAQAWGDGPPPHRALEVGCGDGSLLAAVSLRWPQAAMLGVEPSAAAVATAQSLNRPVWRGMIGQPLPDPIAESGFELIYSVHVIEHTPDPAGFLSHLSALLAPGGRIIITCPDGAIPHAELIHPDHLFSMTPEHLAGFAGKASLKVQLQTDCPAGAMAEASQLMVCGLGEPTPLPAFSDVDALYRARQTYLDQWRTLEATLLQDLNPAALLYCFGAGGWANNIACYCPDLWDKVAACVIDGAVDATLYGKPVLDYRQADQPRQYICAVNPALQARLSTRLERAGNTVLAWPDGLTA